MKTDILAQLVFATNGVGLRTFAKQLGWNDLMSLSRELQVLQAEGFVRFSGGRWKATPKGELSVKGAAHPPLLTGLDVGQFLPPRRSRRGERKTVR